MIGLVFNIQNFSINDGPGIRTTIFMKGCNLRCLWCHNPESHEPRIQIQFFGAKCIGCGVCAEICANSIEDIQSGIKRSARFTNQCSECAKCTEVCYSGALTAAGKEYEPNELITLLLKNKPMLQKYGGVTFSGGEPLMQSEFIYQVMSELKKNRIHTAIETALNQPWDTVKKMIPVTDLFYCDIKAIDCKKHLEGTGTENERILKNICKLSEIGAEIILRIPVVPGFNDGADDMESFAKFVSELPNHHEIELLPFHNICKGKYDSLGIVFKAKDIPEPTKEKMLELNSILRSKVIK